MQERTIQFEDKVHGTVTAKLVNSPHNGRELYTFSANGEEFDFVELSFSPSEDLLTRILKASLLESDSLGSE